MTPSKGFGKPSPTKKSSNRLPKSDRQQELSANAVSEALSLAMQYYQAGRLAAAEQLYHQILKQQPDHPEALHRLGIIGHRTSRTQEAITYLKQAIALTPDNASVHNTLGIVLAEQQELDTAVHHLQEAIRLNPNHANAHSNLGNVLRLQEKFQDAWFHLQKALVLNPDFPAAHNNLGLTLTDQGDLEQAILHLRRAIALNPTYVEAYYNLGLALKKQNNLEAATDSFQKAIALNPHYLPAYISLGTLLRDQDQLDAAILTFQKGLTLSPENANLHCELGITFKRQGNWDAAEQEFYRALDLDPENFYAHSNLGGLWWSQRQIEKAIASYQTTIRLKPDSPETHVSLAYAYLIQGEFQKGFAEFEWRWQMMPSLPLTQPVWDGSPLMENETILVYSEGGFGDIIQFVRYIPLLKQRCGWVMVICQTVLQRLLATMPEIDQLLMDGEPLPESYRYVSLLNLPQILETTLETIPAPIPYLLPPDNSSLTLALIPETTRRIGVVWASGQHKVDTNLHPLVRQGLLETYQVRSCPLSLFARLFALPGISFYSLQVGANASDIHHLESEYPLCDLTPQIRDFADTAALIAQMDLVISVDTAVAHLAGAMGKPVWTLLPFAADWRWFLNSSETPWYPTMRLFRQPAPGDWDSVLTRIAEALQNLSASPEVWFST